MPKGLNLSEDIFAGMDGILRGHSVVHREYMLVGKGRDMGFLSILGFFCKLSCGTAQMTTSRQCYRLGTRLGLARALGYYIAHIGFYLNQLHFYHTTWGFSALAFVGAACQGTGVLPGAAEPAAAGMNNLYGLLYLLFMSSGMSPLLSHFGTDESVAFAVFAALKQFLSFSPLFFVFQSKCIGHFFSTEFAMGGATYIPTGSLEQMSLP